MNMSAMAIYLAPGLSVCAQAMQTDLNENSRKKLLGSQEHVAVVW